MQSCLLFLKNTHNFTISVNHDLDYDHIVMFSAARDCVVKETEKENVQSYSSNNVWFIQLAVSAWLSVCVWVVSDQNSIVKCTFQDPTAVRKIPEQCRQCLHILAYFKRDKLLWFSKRRSNERFSIISWTCPT